MEIFLKRILSVLFSTRLMLLIILVFAISIAIATFIENDFGSQTARAVVYNSGWFNALLFLGIINLTGTIIAGKLYRREKLSIFIFHMAFLIILTGAAITRFFGFEGFMHIRSGETSAQIISTDNYFSLSAGENGTEAHAEKVVYLSAMSRNRHHLRIRIPGKKITAECIQVIPNAVESISDDPNGEPMIELIISGEGGRQSVILTSKQPRRIGNLLFTMNDSANREGVNFLARHNEVAIHSASSAVVMKMATQQTDSISAGTYHPVQLKSLYNIGGIFVVPQLYNPSGRIKVTSDKNIEKDILPDALIIRISSGMESRSIRFMAHKNLLNTPAEIMINGTVAAISYGPKVIQIPFELGLRQFILERYPGSNSPSWFESRIQLTDKNAGIHEERRVYMNNILKYKGYRFYQSSYDSDEMGTIFSVNHDFAGTLVTYTGYLMLAIGIVFSLFNRNSRLGKLSAELTRMRSTGNKIILIASVLAATAVNSPNVGAQSVPDSVYIDKEHAGRFGELLVQDPGGRIKPLNTLSSEFLRKVSGKTAFLEQIPDQVFLGMIAHPDFWQKTPMIKVGHPEIQKLLNIQGSFVSFVGVFDMLSEQNPYMLNSYVNDAYQKKPAIRNKFDTEMIRLDERINLCYQVYSGNILRLFPKLNDTNNTWYSPDNVSGNFVDDDSVFVSSILPLYLQSLSQGARTKNILVPDEAISALQTFQSKYGINLIPSTFKIKLEIMYNRINIFDRLGSAYGIIGFVLLIFQFISIFAPRINLKLVVKVTGFLIYLLFVIHLVGLIARWHISGHAPWSNGYEALVYIAFATVLAGIIFSRKSSMTLAVTSLLAWLILFVAHLNWMDPEITNLVPVLKSYWLLIHVAIITASYGFMALGALMAFLNLILMIVQTKSNAGTTGKIISEFSMIIEMTLIIGLYMLTIGTFLGGVWANESWGRYWGWDPKETWALVSILVYAFVAHMRLVPGLKGNYIFNLMALLGFSTIIMTYFGVNYYLSGLHSYAKGDPLPVPSFVYYTLAVVGLIALLAWENQRRNNKPGTKTPVFRPE